MRQAIHHHYVQLTEIECKFVDAVFENVFTRADDHGVPLAGTDIVERAVDALARAVIESRPKEERPDPSANIIDNMQAMQRISGSPTGQKG